MKINKSLILVIGLTILALVAFLVKQNDSSLAGKDRLSAFIYEENIDRIELITAQEQVILHYSNGQWLIDEQTEADNKLIQQLFQSLELLSIQSAVSSNQKESIEQQLKANAKILTIYTGKKQVYTITLGQNKQKDLVQTASGKLYYVSIKGNATESLYNLLKPNRTAWQDRILIDLKPEEISSIQLTFSDNNKSGFFIDSKEQKALYNTKKEIVKNIDSDAFNDYQYFFSGIVYALVDTAIQKPDVNKHLFSLRINTNVSKVIAIEAFELVDLKTRQRNNNAFAGIINNSILVQLNYSDFDPIVVDIDYFLKK